MPPRKSNVSAVSAATGDEGTPSKEREGINIEHEQDLSLPRTMVQRLAKGVLPSNTQIQKDAILAMSKGATVFVNYLSQAANQATISSSRKTIAPTAVLDALHDLEFSDFVPRVQAELKKFNEVQTGKRNEYRRKVKEGKGGTGGGANGTNRKSEKKGKAGGGAETGMLMGEEEEGAERATKRVRRDEGGAGMEGKQGDMKTTTTITIPISQNSHSPTNDDGDGKPDAEDEEAGDEGADEAGDEEEGVDDEEEESGQDDESEDGEGEEEPEDSGMVVVADMDDRIRALAEGMGMSSGDEDDSGASEGDGGEEEEEEEKSK